MKIINRIISAFVLILFFGITLMPDKAGATCTDCTNTYKLCMDMSLIPGLPNVPFNWFTGGPARCVVNRNSCLRGCGYKSCKKSCKDIKRVEINFCKQQFAETKCGIKDRACKKKARKLKRQCKKNARSVKRS